ncbi:hypothetical protein HDU88_005173 [Geranomyces variabilis]|nr:hypothetical protein HDU88_005173 [Geranomyces variabilis]
MCYVCSLHVFAARFPFSGFADYHLAGPPKGSSLLTTSSPVVWSACVPGELIRHGQLKIDLLRNPSSDKFYEFTKRENQTPTTAAAVATEGESPWYADSKRRASVLAAYINDPYPKTEWEKKLHVRPVKLVTFGQECPHSMTDVEFSDDWICYDCEVLIGAPLADPMLRRGWRMEVIANGLEWPNCGNDFKSYYRIIDFDIIDAAGV